MIISSQQIVHEVHIPDLDRCVVLSEVEVQFNPEALRLIGAIRERTCSGKEAIERVCSVIWIFLQQFFDFSSCLKPFFMAKKHEKRGLG